MFEMCYDMFSDTRSVLFGEANKEQEMIQRAVESKDQELSVHIAEKNHLLPFWPFEEGTRAAALSSSALNEKNRTLSDGLLQMPLKCNQMAQVFFSGKWAYNRRGCDDPGQVLPSGSSCSPR